MIAFSDSATAWQPSVVSATADNIQLAYSWIASLTAGGSTFMMKAFQLAFSDSSVYGFNILSGGKLIFFVWILMSQVYLATMQLLF